VEQAISAILLFAGASFFFALAETALFSLNQRQLAKITARHPHRGKIVGNCWSARRICWRRWCWATRSPTRHARGGAAHGLQRAMGAGVDDDLLAALVLLVCEVFPKTLAVRRPERWAVRVAWLMFLFEKISKPLYRVAQWLNAAILKKAAQQSASSSKLTDAEYHELLDMASAQGTLAETEKEIILQIISLDQRVARDVMRPRANMASVSDDASVEDMITPRNFSSIAACRSTTKRRTPSSAS